MIIYKFWTLTRCDGDDSDTHWCQISCNRESHSHDASFRSWIRCLAHLKQTNKPNVWVARQLPHYFFCLRWCVYSDLSVKRCHAGCVDNAASVSVCIWLILPHLTHGKANHVKGSCDVHLQVTNKSTDSKHSEEVPPALFLLLCVNLTLMTRWKSSRLWGVSFLKLYVLTATAMPAQLTARSSLPNFSLARVTAACTSASDVTWEISTNASLSHRTAWLGFCMRFGLDHR